jgi:hypothetical protein
MAKYKFLLCFENNTHDPGFVTDRIVDAFCARCVPVYHGPTSIEKHIPRECFINYRDFGRPEKLAAFLKGMDKTRYDKYIEAEEAFLRSDRTRYFTSDYMFTRIFSRLYGPLHAEIETSPGSESPEGLERVGAD